MAHLEHVTPKTPERATLDISAARAAADEALSLRLGTTTRVQIDAVTARLTGLIESALAELPRDAPGRPRPTRQETAALLAAARTGARLAYSAHAALRDLAYVLRHLATRCEAERAPEIPPGTRVPHDAVAHK